MAMRRTRQLLQDRCCVPVPVAIVQALLVITAIVFVGSASLFSAVVVGSVTNVGSASLIPATFVESSTERFDVHDISSSCCDWKHNLTYH